MSNTSTTAGRYRTRPVEVTAIRFTGTGESCTAVTEFFGGNSRGDNHQWKSCTNDGGWIISPGSRTEFRPGDWIIQDDGFHEVFTDSTFRAEFETIGCDEPELGWDETVVHHPLIGMLRIPLNHDGNDGGVLVLDDDQAGKLAAAILNMLADHE